MAYSQEEVDRINNAIREILDDEFSPIIHEMKKKFTVAEAKAESFFGQSAAYGKQIEEFKRQCQKCHRLIEVKQDVATQYSTEDFEPSAFEKNEKTQSTSKIIQEKPIEETRSPNERPKKDQQPSVSYRDPVSHPAQVDLPGTGRKIVMLPTINNGSTNPVPEVITISDEDED